MHYEGPQNSINPKGLLRPKSSLGFRVRVCGRVRILFQIGRIGFQVGVQLSMLE